MKRISMRRTRAVLAGTDKCPPLGPAPEETEKVEELCQSYRGCGNPAAHEHTCPYQSDIHGDYDTLCNCCDDCSYQCYMET